MQLGMALMVNPPKEGSESYAQWKEEESICDGLAAAARADHDGRLQRLRGRLLHLHRGRHVLLPPPGPAAEGELPPMQRAVTSDAFSIHKQ